MSADGFGGAMASLAAYEILPEQDLVIVPCAGGFDLAWWCALMDAVLGDLVYHPGMSFLIDRRHARSAPTRADVEGIAAYVRDRGDALRGGRWAVVVSSRAERRMVRRLARASVGHGIVTVRAFEDGRAAMEWLRGRTVPAP